MSYPKKKKEIIGQPEQYGFNKGRKEMADEIILRTELEKLVKIIRDGWAVEIEIPIGAEEYIAQAIQDHILEGLGGKK